MRLSDIKCRKVKATDKQQKLSDGGGLYLLVKPSGNKYWRLKYRFQGKEKTLSIGVYPRTSIAEAREKREEAKKLIDNGYDPSELRKLEKLEKANEYENNFESLAREWHQQNIHTWKPDHAARILKRLETDIFPIIGVRPIKMVTVPELLAAIRKIENRGHKDTAHRVMQTCGQVFRYAVAVGKAERDITSDLKGALKPVRGTNYAYLKENELPGFLQKLNVYDIHYSGTWLTKMAFKLLILTFVRSSEIREAKWDEINFEKREWRIPAERMKMKEQHIVPLATQSIKILKAVQELTGDSYSGYIFPGRQNPRRFMSENTFLRAIEVMGYKGKTVGHGFRSTASTILNENGFRPDVIERQLAHCERDQVRAAYNHAQYLDERVKMMQWWGDYLDRALEGSDGSS